MKSFLPLCIAAALLVAPACSSKKDDTAPAVAEPTPSWTATNTNGDAFTPTKISIKPASDSTLAYAAGVVAKHYGHTLWITVPHIGSGGVPGGAMIGYWLTNPLPGGRTMAVSVLATGRPNNHPNSTLTGRLLTINGTQHLYVSGTFDGDLEVYGYKDVNIIFTDLKVY